MIRDGDFFVKLFKSVRVLCNDIVLHFKGTGIHFQGLDSSNISMCEMQWKHSDIDFYNVSDTEDISIGLSLDNLNKVLKLMPNKGAVELWVEPGKFDKLNVRMMNEEKDEVNIVLNLMDIDMDELSIPDTKYSHMYQYGATKVKSIIRDFKEICDVVSLRTNPTGITMNSCDGQVGSVSCELVATTVVDVGEQIEMNFALRYLMSFMEFQMCAEKFEINLGVDMPLMVRFHFKSESYIVFFLAPQIES